MEMVSCEGISWSKVRGGAFEERRLSVAGKGDGWDCMAGNRRKGMKEMVVFCLTESDPGINKRGC